MKWYVVEVSTGDYVSKGYHNRNGAQVYCDNINKFAGGPSYKVVGV